MTDGQKTAYVISQSTILFAVVMGMVAENQQRASEGASPAYVEADFEKAIAESGIHHNDILSLFHDYLGNAPS